MWFPHKQVEAERTAYAARIDVWIQNKAKLDTIAMALRGGFGDLKAPRIVELGQEMRDALEKLEVFKPW